MSDIPLAPAPASLVSRVLAIPGLALAAYAALMIWGAATIWSSWSDVAARDAEVAATEEQLALLRGRAGGKTGDDSLYGLKPGDAYLVGDKATVAMAELQRRVAAGVVAAGGTVLSSQIDRGEAKDSIAGLELAVECEIKQAGLQRLLYDLESTKPFLFVDKLNMRIRNEPGAKADEPSLRVAMRVAAFWRSPPP